MIQLAESSKEKQQIIFFINPQYFSHLQDKETIQHLEKINFKNSSADIFSSRISQAVIFLALWCFTRAIWDALNFHLDHTIGIKLQRQHTISSAVWCPAYFHAEFLTIIIYCIHIRNCITCWMYAFTHTSLPSILHKRVRFHTLWRNSARAE